MFCSYFQINPYSLKSDFKNIQHVQGDLSSRNCDVQGRQKITKDAITPRKYAHFLYIYTWIASLVIYLFRS